MQAMILIVVVLAKERDANSLGVGIILGVVAGAALMGSFVAPRLHRLGVSPRMAIIGFLSILAAAFLLLAPQTPPLTFAFLFSMPALVASITNVILITHELAIIPDRLRGRVLSAIMLLSWGVFPLGSLIAGLLLQGIGPTFTPIRFGLVTLAASAAASLSRSLAHLPCIDND
jgi:predicted MFS family arabinose efflux permease